MPLVCDHGAAIQADNIVQYCLAADSSICHQSVLNP